MNIFDNYTAIELEIAKRNPGFAVVSNVGYAPFNRHAINGYATTKRRGCLRQSGRAPVGAARLQRP